jgi:hypothetical protein
MPLPPEQASRAVTTGAPPPRTARPWWRRLAPVLALALLAPWTAECSWGGFAATDYPLLVVFLSPLYGCAALLIRETARRLGAGWPAVALLAAAFGVYMAGLVDQSMFNPHYLDDTQYAGLFADPVATRVPWLGFSAADALNYVGNHVVLSIGVPIAIIEAFVSPARRRQPWLRPRGLVVVGILFVLGSLVIHADASKGFRAEPHQLVFTAALVVALVGAAFLPRWRRQRPASGATAPRALWVGLVTLAAAASADVVPGWGGIGLHVAVILVAAVLVVRWSRRAGWGRRQALAAWSGPMVLAAAQAYQVPNYAPATPTQAVLGDVTITVITAALLIGAFAHLRGSDGRVASTGPADGR